MNFSPKCVSLFFFLYSLVSLANDYDVSDFNINNVTWIHTNVSQWPETSRITKVSIKESGEVCIHHSKSQVWPAGQALGMSLTGNPWIIVKLNGRYYAGIWEWLRPGQECKMGHFQYGIAGLYLHPTHSLPKHIKREPLNSWVPRGGTIVGFMVSGLARDNSRSVMERSNVHWVMLPSHDGIIKGNTLLMGQHGGGQGAGPMGVSAEGMSLAVRPNTDGCKNGSNCNDGRCSDGSQCRENTGCKDGSTCLGGKCGNGLACRTSSCQDASKCNSGRCSDGSACWGDTICSAPPGETIVACKTIRANTDGCRDGGICNNGRCSDGAVCRENTGCKDGSTCLNNICGNGSAC